MSRHCYRWAWIIASAGTLLAAPPTNYLDRALAAWKAGEHTNALALADLAVAAEPKATRPLNFRAQSFCPDSTIAAAATLFSSMRARSSASNAAAPLP